LKIKKIHHARKRRAKRVRRSLSLSHMRVSVFRSLNNIYAQLIDDESQKTVASITSLKFEKKQLDKKAVAKQVGVDLAKKALSLDIDKACFDRGHYLYHGRIKSLAEGLREGGLKI